jgi:Ca-activated chloride channel family protein
MVYGETLFRRVARFGESGYISCSFLAVNFHFEHIEYLLALAVLPLLILLFMYVLRWKKSVSSRIGNPKLVRQLIQNYSPFRFKIKFAIVLLALVSMILAAANLRKPGQGENLSRKGVDIMMVLDVSKSMLADDYKPDRLERAKLFTTRLMDQLPNDRIGLVLFAGRAYMQMPLTSDHAAGRLFLQAASPDAVPTQGTIIGGALNMANSGFNTKDKKFKAIVLISDGEDHDIEAAKIAKTIADNGVMINTIGIGSTNGTVIIDPETGATKKDAEGNAVITKLNETILQQLAQISNGVYVKLEDVDEAVKKIIAQLNTIDRKALHDVSYMNYRTFFQWFVGFSLLFLLAEFFIPERKTGTT